MLTDKLATHWCLKGHREMIGGIFQPKKPYTYIPRVFGEVS